MIRLASSNLFVGAVKRRPEKVAASLIRMARRHNVIGINEASEADRLLEHVEKVTHWKVYRGRGRSGQEKLGLLVSPDAKGVRFHSHRLTKENAYVGPGAGPSKTTKWMHVATFHLNGDPYAVAVVHLLASQYMPLRAWHTLRMTRRIRRIMRECARQGYAVSVMGDLNNTPGARLLRALYRIGESAQRSALGPKPTHGKRLPHRGRAIDDIIVGRRQVITDFRTIRTPSDHMAVSVTAEHRKRKP